MSRPGRRARPPGGRAVVERVVASWPEVAYSDGVEALAAGGTPFSGGGPCVPEAGWPC